TIRGEGSGGEEGGEPEYRLLKAIAGWLSIKKEELATDGARQRIRVRPGTQPPRSDSLHAGLHYATMPSNVDERLMRAISSMTSIGYASGGQSSLTRIRVFFAVEGRLIGATS